LLTKKNETKKVTNSYKTGTKIKINYKSKQKSRCSDYLLSLVVVGLSMPVVTSSSPLPQLLQTWWPLQQPTIRSHQQQNA